jgi:hypothetical protein
VDETFTSADGQFSSVDPVTDLTFPSAQSDAARIAVLEDRVATREAAVQKLQGK